MCYSLFPSCRHDKLLKLLSVLKMESFCVVCDDNAQLPRVTCFVCSKGFHYKLKSLQENLVTIYYIYCPKNAKWSANRKHRNIRVAMWSTKIHMFRRLSSSFGVSTVGCNSSSFLFDGVPFTANDNSVEKNQILRNKRPTWAYLVFQNFSHMVFFRNEGNYGLKSPLTKGTWSR